MPDGPSRAVFTVNRASPATDSGGPDCPLYTWTRSEGAVRWNVRPELNVSLRGEPIRSVARRPQRRVALVDGPPSSALASSREPSTAAKRSVYLSHYTFTAARVHSRAGVSQSM